MRHFFIALPLLASCASLPNVDPRAEYADAIRIAQLRPVYPPRQNFRVGSVYYFAEGRDANEPGIYTGHLRKTEDYATEQSRNSLPSYIDRDKLIAAGADLPFSDPSLLSPAVFPSVKLSASAAAGLGISDPRNASRFAFGRARMVTVNFANTLRFGLPEDNMPPPDVYEPELIALVRQPGGFCSSFPPQAITGPEGITIAKWELPWVRIVTAVILSDRFVAETSESRAAGAAMASGVPTGATAPSVTLNVAVPSDASPAQVQELINGVSNQTGESGLGISGSSTSVTGINKTTGGYVAIAYDAFDVSPEKLAIMCSD